MYFTAIAVADLSSHGMCVPVGYVLEPGNEMSQTRWNPEGEVLFIVMIMSFDVFDECRD